MHTYYQYNYDYGYLVEIILSYFLVCCHVLIENTTNINTVDDPLSYLSNVSEDHLVGSRFVNGNSVNSDSV